MGAALALLAVALWGAAPTAEPSLQAEVYYNARLALREGRPTEALKLWFLRTALASRDDAVSGHDGDFHSLAWAALGARGLCPDGLPFDGAGVGLWPLALHNYALRNRRPLPPGTEGTAFLAFRVGRQQREVSIHDVLDAEELKALSLRRGFCLWRYRIVGSVDWPWAELADSDVAARALRLLLREALARVDWGRVVGRAAVEARIFDLNLRLTAVRRRAARRARREALREGREGGLGREALEALKADAGQPDLDPESRAILARSLGWTAEEWLTLSADRRQYLFAQALILVEDKARVRPLAQAVADQLLAQRQGAELMGWLAHATGDDVAAREAVWAGERGERLQALDPASGFTERGVIALHRGVAHLEAGDLPSALRAFAHALSWAESSKDAEGVRALARRWLSFVAAKFQVDDELLAMLAAVVPRGDFAPVLEDQIWQAAFSADAASFARCLKHQPPQGALAQRAELLAPLAAGELGAFADAVGALIDESPYFAARFTGKLLDRMETQTVTVRRRLVPLLEDLKARYTAVAEAPGPRGQTRRAAALVDRLRAQLDGLVALPEDASAADRAAALGAGRGVFVGNVRVAPSDPLPWPFRAPEVRAPSVFTPLVLRPEEWAGADGRLVFGWRVTEP
ncbi:MAG: hypothetical protein H6702_00245 [Myxococcales bacterium]|nr:hypothetical protein [Myxococcales bacterium]